MVFLQHTSEWPAELVKRLLVPTLRLSDSVNVLVSYCHCNKLPQTPRPQNTILLSHGSVSQKSDDSTARWILSLVLQGWSQGTRRAAFLPIASGEESAFEFVQVISHTQFLAVVGLRSSLPCWLSISQALLR